MTRTMLWGLGMAVAVNLSGQDAPRKAQPEAMSPAQFSEAHSAIFQADQSRKVGAITNSIAPGTASDVPQSPLASRNFIDDRIFGKMQRDGVPHSALSSDFEFLRRVSLDITGRIPSTAEIQSFLADKDVAKRDKLIDQLLASEAYVDKWAYFFMDVFRANGKMGRGQNLFHYWMKENLQVDRPYDDAVRDIVAASAKSNHVVAASNVIAREHVQGKPQPDDGKDFGMVQQLDTHDELAVLYGKTFLGVNFSCISCHDGRGHLEKVNVYLSKRKRVEFYQLAGFIGKSRYLMYWEDGKPQSGEFMI